MSATEATASSHHQAEILWDTWGVPHIFAPDHPGLFRALGWAQAKAHGNLLLKLYGLARGRGAEYWGERYLESDKFLRRMGIVERAAAWKEAQTPAMRANLEAFVAGLNAYLDEYPEQIAPELRRVLPLGLEDVFAHIQRVYLIYLTQNGQRPMGAPYNDILPFSTLFPDGPELGTGIAGSNAWALGPSRTAHQKTILLANPHLYWADFHTFFEVHLNGPGVRLYGVAQVGWPVLRYGFNEQLGWAHTVNTLKGWDAFALQTVPGGYLLDGEVRPFEHHTQTLQVRQADGRMRQEEVHIHRSLHGPVVAQQHGKPIAVRVVGVDQIQTPGIFEQYWAMGLARNLGEFEAALRRQQNPMFTVIYADAEGNILHLFGGLVPRRKGGNWQDWAGTLPGDDSSLLWTQAHAYDELPRVLNPASGWLQNANNPPWFTTLPQALNPQDYPAYMAPRLLTPREQRSIGMIGSLEQATLETLLDQAGSTRSEVALRLVDPLLEAVARGEPLARQAADVLRRWDRSFDPESVGAQLFVRWVLAMQPSDRMLSNLFARPWSEEAPLQTPEGLADPRLAVARLEQVAQDLLAEGSLERPWGEVVRVRMGEWDFPGHGLLDPFGVFRVSGFIRSGQHWDTAFGTTYMAAVEFSQPLRAKVLLSYGNSTQPGSRHRGDQLELLAHKRYRDVWLDREEIEANTAEREVIG